MSNEPNEIGRIADAAKEVAKTTAKALPSIEKLGAFLYRVIGEPVELLSGTFISDPLKAYRFRRLVRLQEETERVLATRNSLGTKQLPPKVSVPLLEYASLEDDDDLQILWARLLASAMGDDEPEIDVSYIDVLKRLNPKDVQLLAELSDQKLEFRVSSTHETISMMGSGKRLVIKRVGVDPALKISAEKLESAGLVGSVGTLGNLALEAAENGMLIDTLSNGDPIAKRQLMGVRLDHDADVVKLTEFGRAFLRAVRPE